MLCESSQTKRALTLGYKYSTHDGTQCVVALWRENQSTCKYKVYATNITAQHKKIVVAKSSDNDFTNRQSSMLHKCVGQQVIYVELLHMVVMNL